MIDEGWVGGKVLCVEWGLREEQETGRRKSESCRGAQFIGVTTGRGDDRCSA